MVKNRFYSYIRRVMLGKQNPYQIVINNNHESGISNGSPTMEMESPFSERITPYSENGSVLDHFWFKYSSGTNFSFYDSLQGENEMEFVEDPDFND